MRPLSPEQWPAISALLDEALALPASERDTWLESLSGERAVLRQTLRELLMQSAVIETGQGVSVTTPVNLDPTRRTSRAKLAVRGARAVSRVAVACEATS